jgi:hypothetical protein
MLNRLEMMRKQIDDQRKANTGKADVLAQLDALDRKMLAVELNLASRTDLNSDDKYFVEKPRIYLQLIWLAGVVGTGAGDVAGGADTRPTQGAKAALSEAEKALSTTRAAYDKLLREDVPAFNRAMNGKVNAIALEIMS